MYILVRGQNNPKYLCIDYRASTYMKQAKTNLIRIEKGILKIYDNS